MKSVFIFSVFLLINFQRIRGAPAEGDLFLTPLIKSGDVAKARAQAEDSTKLLRAGNDVKSYSGFLTVNEKANSNLFFWFFPAQKNPEAAPVILWVNDIPGFSSLKGVFLETGPFSIDENNMLRERNASWTKTHSMLYIDVPGTGFSFADDKNAYANGAAAEGTELYEALKQFFTLFNDFQPRELYLAGETFAATLIPHIAKHIDMQNAKNDLKINLKGFIIGSPLLDPEQYLYRGEFLHSMGLFDEEQQKALDAVIKQAVDLIKAGKVVEGSQLGWSTAVGPDNMYKKFAGFSDFRNVLNSKAVADDERYQKFIDTKEVHNYLHVGLHNFVGFSFEVFHHFAKDMVGKHEDVLQEMLDKGYRVLMYSAQFDLILPAQGITNIVSKLKWKGADNYNKAPRKVWTVNDDVAGYVKMADNLVYAMVRNAGNYAIRDQPEWVLDLVERFLYNKGY